MQHHANHLEPAALRDFFRDHGLRCTRQREMIYATLAACRSHPTAEDLHRLVRAADPGLSLATIYNTLDTFVERGLCRKIPSPAGNGPSRYDADTHPHAHILLEDGTIIDIPDDLARPLVGRIDPELAARLESRLGVEITGVQIQVTARRPEA